MNSINLQSNIYLERRACISLRSKNNELYCKLTFNEDYYDEHVEVDPYEQVNIYKQINCPSYNVYYEKITCSRIEETKLGECGFYLFVFNKSNLFVKFLSDEISYKLENIADDILDNLAKKLLENEEIGEIKQK